MGIVQGALLERLLEGGRQFRDSVDNQQQLSFMCRSRIRLSGFQLEACIVECNLKGLGEALEREAGS